MQKCCVVKHIQDVKTDNKDTIDYSCTCCIVSPNTVAPAEGLAAVKYLRKNYICIASLLFAHCFRCRQLQCRQEKQSMAGQLQMKTRCLMSSGCLSDCKNKNRHMFNCADRFPSYSLLFSKHQSGSQPMKCA